MSEIVLRAPTVEATRAIGAALAPLFKPGDVVSLAGSLGAGKTAFTQGAARALGVTAVVTSPTFVLVRDYDGEIPIHHVDVYRLTELQDVIDLGFDEMIDGDSVTFIEWGDAVESLYTQDFLRVEIVADPVTEERTLRIVPNGSWTERSAELATATREWSPT